VFFLFLSVVAVSTSAHGAPKPAPAKPGEIDDAALKATAQESRLNFLASKTDDLKIHLPPDKMVSFQNSNGVHALAGRVARGQEKREKLLAEAPKILQNRQKEIEEVYGDKFRDAQELVKTPHNQAELFLLMLSDAVQQMNLPLDQSKPRMLLGGRLQKLFDEDSQRRSGKAGPQRDEAWLGKYQEETEKALFALLKPEQQKSLIRVWPVLFPDGPKPPKE
jgi:hypothetical protein